MKRRAIGIAAAAILLGVVGGLSVGWVSGPGTMVLSEPSSLFDEVASTDLLIEVDEITFLGAEEFDFGVVESWSLHVVDVLQFAEVAATQEQEPDVAYVLPSIGPGEDVIVGATRSNLESPQVHGFDDVSGRAIVGATYLPPHRINGHKSGWVLRYVVTVGTGGDWTFHNSGSGGVWRAQLSLLAERFAYMSETELMVAWSGEADAERRGEAPGPITQALFSLDERDPWVGWSALPASERPLDEELTPPEVLATLRYVSILVDIESAPQLDDRFLVIKTDSGIVHSAVLTAGNHVTQVLSSPGDEWRIVVTDNPVRGNDIIVATITAEEWTRAADSDEAALIVYSQAEVGTARIIDQQSARDLIDQWTADDADLEGNG